MLLLLLLWLVFWITWFSQNKIVKPRCWDYCVGSDPGQNGTESLVGKDRLNRGPVSPSPTATILFLADAFPRCLFSQAVSPLPIAIYYKLATPQHTPFECTHWHTLLQTHSGVYPTLGRYTRVYRIMSRSRGSRTAWSPPASTTTTRRGYASWQYQPQPIACYLSSVQWDCWCATPTTPLSRLYWSHNEPLASSAPGGINKFLWIKTIIISTSSSLSLFFSYYYHYALYYFHPYLHFLG